MLTDEYKGDCQGLLYVLCCIGLLRDFEWKFFQLTSVQNMVKYEQHNSRSSIYQCSFVSHSTIAGS